MVKILPGVLPHDNISSRKLALPSPPAPTPQSFVTRNRVLSLCRARLKPSSTSWQQRKLRKILLERPERSQSPWTSPSEWSHGGEGIRHGKGPLWSISVDASISTKHSSRRSKKWGGVNRSNSCSFWFFVFCLYLNHSVMSHSLQPHGL